MSADKDSKGSESDLLKEAITDKVEALNEKTLLDVLNEHNTDAALPASGGSVSCTEDDLLSDYISDFKVGIDGNKVTVSFDMKSGKKTYKIDETTKVRNGMVVYP